MPKVVEHAQRRTEIAEAVWRVVRRDGVAGATVRAVAAESGWSVGALRHYFTTQQDLLAFTMQLVADRATARIRAVPLTGSARGWVERVLVEVLPVNDEGRTENEVWFAFNARALADPALRAVREATYDALAGLCRTVVTALLTEAAGGTPPQPARVDLLARELNAVLDGLAVHTALRPDRWSERQLRRVLRHHLDGIAAG